MTDLLVDTRLAAVRGNTSVPGIASQQFEALVKAGIFTGDPEILGYVFWATMHGLIVLHLAGKLPGKPDFRTCSARRGASSWRVCVLRVGGDRPLLDILFASSKKSSLARAARFSSAEQTLLFGLSTRSSLPWSY